MFPNNDPAASMVAFYGCLLAEVVPVPIEVPLTRKVRTASCSGRPTCKVLPWAPRAFGRQRGFALGSCG